MISNYVVKEDRIILYLDYSFEIGSFNGKKVKDSINNIISYLKNTKINLDGKKVVLMLGSTLLATLIYTNGTLKALDVSSVPDNQQVAIVENVAVETEASIEEEKSAEVEAVKEDIKEHIVEEKPKLENNKPVEREKSNTQKASISNKSTTKSTPNSSKTTSSTDTSSTNKSSSTSTNSNQDSAPKTETESKTMVTIHRSNGTIIQKELEEYIVGVVAAEMPASFNVEALKAQAVIARTYTLNSLAQGKRITDSVSTQAYIDESQMKSKWGNEYSKYYNKIVGAVKATKGQYITYNGKYIDAVYHSTSNGKTEDAVNVWGNSVPYLKSVDSSWDKSASSYLKIDYKEFSTLMKILGFNIDDNTEVSVLSRNNSGRVSEVKIGNNTYTGVELRNLLGLRSADFDISIENGQIVIITRGYGHGVGMSQYGANGMANSGHNYKQIITHYYTGVKINS